MGIGALMESNVFRIRLIRVVVYNLGCFELESKLVLILRASHPLVIDLSRHLENWFGRLAGLLSNS
jgi:hypothetical protein